MTMQDHQPAPAIPVLAMPHLDPGMGRVEMRLPEGQLLSEIVAAAFPILTPEERLQLRVVLVTPLGAAAIDARYWTCVRPRPGVRVVIRAVPGKSALRSALMVVVAIAAAATAAYVGPMLAGAMGVTSATGIAAVSSLVGLAVTAVGMLAINALLPVDDLSAENRYAITGWQNQVRTDGAVPLVLGKLRWAPPFAALSYTEIVGDYQYVRAVLCLGYGELEISDIWIGDTSIDAYDEVTTEICTGLATDDPISLYPTQVAEEAINVEIQRPLNRNDLGEVTSGSSLDPVIRTTGDDATGATLIFAWPSGLVRVDDDGDKRNRSVSILIEYRPDDGTEDWTAETTLTVTAKKLEMFWRSYTITFPDRARYDIRVTMQTEESDNTQVQQRTTWVALQTLRPEYPINFDSPLALVGIRIRATYQLQGTLDTVSMIVQRVCPDYDAATDTWITRATRNPASLFRYALQSPALKKPVADSAIDLDALAEWHTFCADKGLECNDVLEDTGLSFGDALKRIALAGRAVPRWDGTKWTVIIDKPRNLVVDHINPRNSAGFTVSRTYFTPPDGFRVKFLDQTSDYQSAERLVPWPGNESGDISVTEELSLPGKTRPAEIYREARRRMYETIYRPDVYQVTQDGPACVVTRGDLVALSHYVLGAGMVAARVKAVVGQLIEIDEKVTMVAGTDYGIRFRVISEDDTIGTSVVRQVETVAGAGIMLIRLADTDATSAMPGVGDLIHFGVLSEESLQCIVIGIEPGESMTRILKLADAAPEIDTILDAEEIPDWSRRAGYVATFASSAPGVPSFGSITTSVTAHEAYSAGHRPDDREYWYTYTTDISVSVRASTSVVPATRFEVDHRVSGTGAWTTLTIAAADGGADITGYDKGAAVELRVRAIGAGGTASDDSATVTVTVDGSSAVIPGDLDADGVSLAALLGGVKIALESPDDDSIASVQIYYQTSGDLDTDTAATRTVPVTAGGTVSIQLGAKRSTLITSGSMSDETAWTMGAGWAIASGIATHTAGEASDLAQDLTLVAGTTYRVSYTVSGMSAGSVMPVLSGGTEVTGTAVTADGTYHEALVAGAGNTTFALRASADFDGSVDAVVVYSETSSCLDQTTYYVWLVPLSTSGVSGAVLGPYEMEVM